MSMPGEQQFSCRIELSQTDGITIVIKDSKKKDQYQRKVVLGPTSITLLCQDGTKSSTITQKDDSLQIKVQTDSGTTTIDQDAEKITMKCKTFTVEAETVTVKASKDGLFETQGKCDIASTQDCTVKSSAKLDVKSVQKMTIHSDSDAAMDATSSLSLAAMQSKLSGTSTLKLESQGTAQLAALSVDVKGDTNAGFQAPMTSVGGQGQTTVNGGIVQVSGSLVKLG